MLPGALSAYRYIALKTTMMVQGHWLLISKVKIYSVHMTKTKRIPKLTFSKQICTWLKTESFVGNWYQKEMTIVLKFVKLATGETDVPETIAEFLSQRRRWINGAFLLLCTPCITLENMDD